LIIDFLRRTSRRSIETRFFSPSVSEDLAMSEVSRPSEPSLALSLLLYCEVSGRWELVGHGEYVRDGVRSHSAEVAFLVTDAYQGKGVATILLIDLARFARQQGIRTFRAMVLRANLAMLEVFRGSGFPLAIEYRPDQVVVTLSIRDEPHPTFEPPPPLPSSPDLASATD
jgi:GNAT superfamily N-acetyltransferase